MTAIRILLLLAWLLLSALPAAAQDSPSVNRGRLLYENHCSNCHSEKMHWRDGRLVTDWDSLKFQVRRFQLAANLPWSEDDVTDVSRYLDQTLYRLPQTTARWDGMVASLR